MTKRPKFTSAIWNQFYGPGTSVVVKLDDGKLWHTKTRSVAWDLGGGQPVVMLEGKSGGYDLDRVTPLELQDTVLA
jgi:hypothetical protein